MAEDETGEVPKLPPDARLESLDERLDRLQQAEAKRAPEGQPDRVGQFGQRMAGQMIGAPAGGLLFGWGLDTLFNTKPLFMIILMFVGFGVGIRNVYYWTKTTPRPAADRSTRDKD
jgi:ATP synthase protein I